MSRRETSIQLASVFQPLMRRSVEAIPAANRNRVTRSLVEADIVLANGRMQVRKRMAEAQRIVAGLTELGAAGQFLAAQLGDYATGSSEPGAEELDSVSVMIGATLQALAAEALDKAA